MRYMLLVASALLLASGCRMYRADPLLPAEVFRRIEAQRQPAGAAKVEPSRDLNAAAPPAPGEAFTLERAAVWLRMNSPDVQETLAEYRTALAVAKIDTPLPNPVLEIGPQFGFGPDMESVNRTMPFGSIGVTIPLGARLRRQTELNRARAEVACVHALARFREIYLELRAHYATFAISRQRLATRREIAVSAEKTLEAGRQLVKAGQATALDMAFFELEHQRSLAEVVAVEREVVEAEGELSRLLGMHFDCFRELPEQTLPALPETVPSYDELRERLILNHTELARIRAEYEAAERALRLEISKQYPDLQIGSNWDSGVGEKKTVIGLTLGIEVPLFDRNQQGIAEAKGKREEIRARYEAEVKRALAELERAHRDLDRARRNAVLLTGKILPLAQTNVELARRSLQAGEGNAVQLLDAERSAREVRIEALNARLGECHAWIGLEQAVGYPLVAFPSEQKAAVPQPPEPLDVETGEMRKGQR